MTLAGLGNSTAWQDCSFSLQTKTYQFDLSHKLMRKIMQTLAYILKYSNSYIKKYSKKKGEKKLETSKMTRSHKIGVQ
uniref:Uncharacterized protein n=1 Tax=Rhizophora mucronata TaxID=61149 RepID=A0A2P2M0L6_RHIMU